MSLSGPWLPTGDAGPGWWCWNRPSPWRRREAQKRGGGVTMQKGLLCEMDELRN